VVAAGIDETEGLLGAVGHEHGVADDLAVEINVGLGVDGDAGELRWAGTWGRSEGESEDEGGRASQSGARNMTGIAQKD
jgi:hypothetical protein